MQAKAKIMVVKDVEREDIEFISKTLHCLPIAHVDHMRPEKLGRAAMVEEVDVSQNGLLLCLHGGGGWLAWRTTCAPRSWAGPQWWRRWA